MKLNDEAIIALFITGVSTIFITLLVGDFLITMEQSRLYQKIYSNNMECRTTIKTDKNPGELNQYCGEIPQIKDFHIK